MARTLSPSLDYPSVSPAGTEEGSKCLEDRNWPWSVVWLFRRLQVQWFYRSNEMLKEGKKGSKKEMISDPKEVCRNIPVVKKKMRRRPE